jgi:hypothetical protein
MAHEKSIIEILGRDNVIKALGSEYGAGNYLLVYTDNELLVKREVSNRVKQKLEKNWGRENGYICEFFLDSMDGEFQLTALVNKHCN